MFIQCNKRKLYSDNIKFVCEEIEPIKKLVKKKDFGSVSRLKTAAL